MCVGLPARVEEIKDGVAKVNVSGATRDISTDFITGLAVGDYVMIHAGIAIARITAEEAEETQAILEELYGLEY
jgi:hydrogenase expression/formation protein HypC